MKNATLENLLIQRDRCMKEVHGESYKPFMESAEELVSGITDILDKIFK